MKKFIVLFRAGNCCAHVIREFDENRAQMALHYAEALEETEENDNLTFMVAELHTVKEWRKIVKEQYSEHTDET